MSDQAYLIECVLQRKGGTTVTMGDDEYRFAPNEHGAHVCEVEDPDHAQAFLAIREGYAIYTPGNPGRNQAQLDKERRKDEVDSGDLAADDQGFTIVEEILDDSEGVDPLEAEARSNPDSASNKSLQRWATIREVNFRNKQSVFDYGLHTFGVELDRDMTAINMVRELVKIEVAHLESETE